MISASSCVCVTHNWSQHTERAQYVSSLCLQGHLSSVLSTPKSPTEAPLRCSGCPSPFSMPFLLTQAWLPAQRLSLLSSYSSILLLLCPRLLSGASSTCLFLPVSMMGSYLLWPGSLDSEKGSHILAPSHTVFWPITRACADPVGWSKVLQKLGLQNAQEMLCVCMHVCVQE